MNNEMQNSFSKKITKPENCIIGFGIPTSEDEFINDQNHPNKSFAKKFTGVRKRYEKEFLKHFNKVEPLLTKLGVNVIRRLTLDDFGALFQDEKLQVIVLFSHWSIDRIEFFDGYATTSQIVEKVPFNYSGLLDLNVCHPQKLTIVFRKERPNCLLRFTDQKATPFIWLYFYLALFKVLSEKKINYLVAIESVIKEFLATTKSNKA